MPRPVRTRIPKASFASARPALTGALTLVLVALLGAPATEALADEQTCVTCHRRRTSDHLRAPLLAMDDVHGSNDVLCASCHGGRPDELSMHAHDPGSGFTSGHHGFAQVAMCGQCHDGSEEGLEDVLTRYRAGSHMRAVTEGEPGARCSDCHGSHGVLRADDPEAATSRANSPHTCGACHSVMGPDIPSDQLRQWASSVHGLAHARGDEEAPTCADCHDPHENNAGLAAVARCGECHEAARAAFELGPHATHFRDYGFLDCTECHGSHEVRSPDATLLSGRSAACARCHRRGQEPFDQMREIASAIASADRSRRALEPTDRRRQDFARAIHELDLEAIQAAAEALPAVAPEADSEVAELRLRPPPTRWDTLAYSIGAASLAALGLFWFFRYRKKS